MGFLPHHSPYLWPCRPPKLSCQGVPATSRHQLPDEFEALNATGRYRQAFASIAPQWPHLLADGDLPTLLALHQLCLRIGSDTRRRWIARRMLQRWPGSLPVLAVQVRDLLRRGRLFHAWEATQGHVPAANSPDETLDWHLAIARVHSQLRDFDTANARLDDANAIAQGHIDILRERAWVMRDQDDVAGAINLLTAALQEHPLPDLEVQLCWMRHERNDPGAGAALADAHARYDSPLVDSVYASHCLEHGKPATARDLLAKLLAEPHHEPRLRRGWRVALLHACRDLGDDTGALAVAMELGPKAAELVARLRQQVEAPQPRTRVVLPVPFVRQDHMTCSPATMAALLATFDVTIDQREIAQQITADGTASTDELLWAEQRGLVARFFQFDADVARDLLARGAPFAFTTRFESNSHRQAVIGYDTLLDTFVLRDPTGNFRREMPSEWVIKMAERGGECALLLPAAVADAQTLPTLPQEAATMAWIRARLDWRQRQPQAAEARLQALAEPPTGSLQFDIELQLASERGDRRRILELWQQRWQAHPDDVFWRSHYAAELLDQNHWRQARELLETWAPGSHSPLLLQMLAEQWRVDAQRRHEAEQLLRRALRWAAADGRCWQRLARIIDSDRNRQALVAELTRIATCLQPYDEWLAMAHFRQLCNNGKAEAGLQFLSRRSVVRGGRSAAMAISYAVALEEQHQPDAAVTVLQEALPRDEDNGAARRQLFALLCRLRRHEDARQLLNEASLRPVDTAFCRHQLAMATGDQNGAMVALEAVIAADPWNDQAQAMRLEATLERHGMAAALRAANALAAETTSPPVLLLRVAEFYSRCDQHDAAEQLLRRLVAEHQHEYWLRGRLARHLLLRNRPEEARPLVESLRASHPDSSPVWSDISTLAWQDGDQPTARAAVQRAFELDPSNIGMARRLVDWAETADEARTHLRFALRTIAERPLPPDSGMMAGLQDLLRMLPEAEIEAWFTALAAAHPREIAHRMAHIDHVGTRDPQRAAALAATLAAERPWESGHALRHAALLREIGQYDAAQEVLQALVERDPACSQAHADLGELLQHTGKPQQALQVFERGIAHSPGAANLHGLVAHTAWGLGARERALTAVAKACELDPDYDWAWHARMEWLTELDRHAEALAIAEQFVTAQPRAELAHRVHAIALAHIGRHGERMEALRRALELRPRLGETRMVLVDALIELKRFDEARNVLSAGEQLSGEQPEFVLRAAQIERTDGQLARAREQLRAALDRHPEYLRGWVRWLAWCEEDHRNADILALADHPPPALAEEAVFYGYLGGAHRQNGNATAAEQQLRRALQLAPGYSWARQQLCELALERNDPAAALQLLGDHEDVEAQPFSSAVLIAKAAARAGNAALAGRAFRRLLQQPDATAQALGTVDALCNERHRKAHQQLWKELTSQSDVAPAVLRNLALVEAWRRNSRQFWRLAERLRTSTDPAQGMISVIEMMAECKDMIELERVAAYIRGIATAPIADADTVGRLMYILSNKAGDALSASLFAKQWRRHDLQGYMLANFGNTLRRLGHLRTMAEVATFALQELPHDHSIWWHRRNLAEAALQQGDHATVRELCAEVSHEYPSQRLALHQLALVAELRSLPWPQRPATLRQRTAEMFRRYDAAAADSNDTELADLRPHELLRCCPWPALLLYLGRPGHWLLRRLAANG